MIWLWPIAFLMAAAATAAVLVPLLRRPRPPAAGRAEYDLVVYKDQLQEIERDLERGLIQPAEAEAATVEVQRRMLAAADAQPDAGAGAAAVTPGRARLAVAVGAAIPVAAFVLYFFLGSPDLPGQPFAERNVGHGAVAEAGPAHGQMSEMAAKLAEKMQQNPNDPRGWTLLGRTYITINRFPEALDAFRRARDLSPDNADIASLYAETLVMTENGRVSPEALGIFRDIARTDPANPQARYYVGLALAQAGKVMDGLREWVDLRALSPADAPWLTALNEQIERARADLNLPADALVPSPAARELAKRMPPPAAGPGPSAADVEAARQMTPEQQNQMVRTMVARLAERLKQNPDDLEGWRRLERAYQVLGETAKADEAKARVEALEKKAR